MPPIEDITLTPAEKCYQNHLRGSREYYQKNKEKVSERMKTWYLTNRESLREYKRQYYQRKKEEKEEKKVMTKIYLKSNIEK
jgi:hypothetical protein